MHTEGTTEELVATLRSPNNQVAYRALKSLEDESEFSNAAYAYFDDFIEMMRDSNSFIRTRGLILIACNAEWDKDGKINKIIDEYLTHITDDKPITARQCVKYLPKIVKAQPQFTSQIVTSLRQADMSQYSDTMRPLVQDDIRDALLALENAN